MRKWYLFFGALTLVAPAFGQQFLPVNHDRFRTALDGALSGMIMTTDDFQLRNDYLERDPYRISLVDRLMNSPLQVLELSASFSHIGDPAEIVAPLMRESPFPMAYRPFRPVIDQDAVLVRFGLQEKFDKATAYRVSYFLSREESFRSDPAIVSPNRSIFDSLIYGYSLLIKEDVADRFRSVDELDSIQKFEDAWAARLVEMTRRVEAEVPAIWGMRWLDVFTDSVINRAGNTNFGGDYLEFLTPYGKMCVGDSQSQYYFGDIFLVIDYGGDDVYDIQLDGVGHSIFILDYAGNDLYIWPESELPPCALGASVIVDFSGNDEYRGGMWSLGTGFFGAGILWDKNGNDRYFGDTFTMGAGCFGFGILRDDQGDDLYNASLCAQGFGFPEGIGILFDASGNDHYFVGGKYQDILRYTDHYLSLGQGFGLGSRPFLSGGIGCLIDKSGNDTYEADIFGQGCSYWYSLGILADFSGNDRYLSYQYGQGGATHMTVGCLYDAGGDDLYFGKGVMQGCGHDRAFAILYDACGNDSYVASDLSQGAGSANGIGIFADMDGADAYSVKSGNVQGYGDPRRDYGSIGVFLDLGGARDSYGGGHGVDSTWWIKSSWGIGVDE